MVTRTFEPMNLVALPRFSAAGAIALGTAVVSAIADAGNALPASCVTAAEKCKNALDDLRKGLVARGGAAEADGVVALDHELDASWAALSSIVAAYVRAPLSGEDAALRDAATRLQRALFADGLRFTQLPYRLEWAESHVRLDRLDDAALTADAAAIGATKLVALVREKHQAYGDAQGLSKASPPSAEAADVRPRLDRFTAVLRTYIVKVSATVEEDDEASRALAERLLAPIARWQSTPATDDADATVPEPPAPPAPTPTP